MSNELRRSAFDALPAHERTQHVMAGGRVVEDAAAPRRVAGAGEIARATFDRMSAAERVAALRSGIRIVDAADAPGAEMPPAFPTKAPLAAHKWARGEHGFLQVPDNDHA